eukprot:GHUV01024857.1.p1 GENE.GHUV01024857.1~~GHUV01024857.1.p1  ORF type:complete len:105 (+),score=12.56 GHUV01024857.1:125-439(+)
MTVQRVAQEVDMKVQILAQATDRKWREPHKMGQQAPPGVAHSFVSELEPSHPVDGKWTQVVHGAKVLTQSREDCARVWKELVTRGTSSRHKWYVKRRKSEVYLI